MSVALSACGRPANSPTRNLYVHLTYIYIATCIHVRSRGRVTHDRGNSVKMTSESYNFASTLVIEMYLGKHDAYSVLSTSQAR